MGSHKGYKSGHILRHREKGFRYKLIGEVVNEPNPAYGRAGARAKYAVVDNSKVGSIISTGYFPYADYTVVRIGKVS